MSTLRDKPVTESPEQEVVELISWFDFRIGAMRYRPAHPFWVDDIRYDVEAWHHYWNVQPMISSVPLGNPGDKGTYRACLNCPLTDSQLDRWVQIGRDGGPGCECGVAA